jgi:hypothetical protein
MRIFMMDARMGPVIDQIVTILETDSHIVGNQSAAFGIATTRQGDTALSTGLTPSQSGILI